MKRHLVMLVVMFVCLEIAQSKSITSAKKSVKTDDSYKKASESTKEISKSDEKDASKESDNGSMKSEDKDKSHSDKSTTKETSKSDENDASKESEKVSMKSEDKDKSHSDKSTTKETSKSDENDASKESEKVSMKSEDKDKSHSGKSTTKETSKSDENDASKESEKVSMKPEDKDKSHSDKSTTSKESNSRKSESVDDEGSKSIEKSKSQDGSLNNSEDSDEDSSESVNSSEQTAEPTRKGSLATTKQVQELSTLSTTQVEKTTSKSSSTQQPTITTSPQTHRPNTSSPQTQQPTITTLRQTEQPTITTLRQTQQPTVTTSPQTHQPTTTTSPQTHLPNTSSPQTQQPTTTTSQQTQRPNTTTSEMTTTKNPIANSSWSTWSTWSECSGLCHNASQSRTRSCSNPGQLCLGSVSESRSCQKDNIIEQDCEQCTLNGAGVGYLASCTNNSVFYQCTRQDSGFTLTLMPCARCTVWNQTLLTCVRDESVVHCGTSTNSSSAGPTVTVIGDKCYIGDAVYGVVAGNPTQYKWYTPGLVYEQACPAGTVFNLTMCTCVIAAVPLMPPATAGLCVGFETMTVTDIYGYLDGNTWVGNHGEAWNSVRVTPSVTDCPVGQKCGQFSGKAYLSLGSLSNAFAGPYNDAFTISFWYQANGTETMGLLTNGVQQCNSQPSVTMTTSGNVISAHVHTNQGVATISGQAEQGWVHVILVRSGEDIRLYLNGKLENTVKQSGSLLPSHCSMFVGLDASANLFTGKMDQICFYKAALGPEDVGFTTVEV